MESIDIRRQTKCAWEEICLKVNKAVVFVDNACAQSLHWNGGAMLLFNAGAVNVKEFSSFESGDALDRKAVFILSGPLVGLKCDVMRDILQASSFQYVLLISSLCTAMHGQIKLGNPDRGIEALHDIEDQILLWMGNMNYTAEVFHVPVVCAPVTHQLFVFPEHQNLFPILPLEKATLKDMNKKDYHSSENFELLYTHLPPAAQLRMKLLVCALNSFLEQLSINEDCYSLGDTSRIVATELASLSWAKQRRKTAEKRASLLLVDRSLDLASAVGHHYETLLDKVTALLPRFPGHCSDVVVDMSSLTSVPSSCSKDVIAAGCLAHPADAQASALLNKMASVKQKESLMEVNRQLVEVASSRNLPLKLTGKPGRVTAETLQNTIQLFKSDGAGLRKHSGLLQLSQAVAHCLSNDSMARMDALLAVEKGLLQSLHDRHAESPLTQIATTINREVDKPREKRTFSLEDIFCLLVYVYSMLEGEDLHHDEEGTLKAALEGVLLKEDLENLPTFLQELFDGEKTEERIFRVLDEVFKKLEALVTIRDNLKQFNSVLDGGGLTSVATLKPMMKQVVEEVYKSQKELVDVEYKSTGFRHLIKSGFGLFMNVSKPHPSDHPLLIVFVIGGVTSTEVRQIREVLSAAKPDTQVIVGSTSLHATENLLHQIFVEDHVN